MRVLVAWDNPTEAELLGLYLAADNEATICLTDADLAAQIQARDDWDTVLLSATFPQTAAEGFETFRKIQQEFPDVPVVVACRPTEMLHLPRFLNQGLRFYLIRDEGGDFIFLALSTLQTAVESRNAEEARKLAERLREEMDGVRRLQESIIPRGVKPPPGYKITARYEPAQVSVVGHRPVVMAGGDYYDLFCPDDRMLVVLVGDASGHGLKACMSIMAMHTLVRMQLGQRFRDTAAFVSEINQRLCENAIVASEGGFITLFYAAIDTVENVVSWTSAGHPVALLHDLDANEVRPVGSDADSGLPLGIYPDVEYQSFKTKLPENSRVLIYSDGLQDALPKDSDVAFGVNGIVKTLRACKDTQLDAALAQLFSESSLFTAGNGRHDDTSVVLVERKNGTA
jgi:serine phosphatase RsbU (regulator of sigma subunit)